MFTLMKDPAFWWPVHVPVPSSDKPGEFETSSFQAQYRLLDVDAHKALMDEVPTSAMDDREFARRVVVSLRLVSDEAGAELPFSPELLEQMLAVPGIATLVTKGYFEGRVGAAEKN